MSSTTLKLPYKRFVAQVSTGAPRSKSTYLALMAENLEALKDCPWREAADVPVSLADHDFTKASHFSDACDAFKMTGNYDSSANTEVAYAGMAAYRFKVPEAATTRSIALSSISLPISRDRFLRSGVHVGVELSDSETPSGDWATVRGAGDLAQTGLSQATAEYLLAGDVGNDTLTVDLSGITGSGNPQPYLWVYLTLEDYTDAWEMYDAKEKRLYAIEGSAMLVGGSAVATFAAAVEPDAAGTVILAGGSSPTWLQPLPTVNVTATAPETALVYEYLYASSSKKNPLSFTRTQEIMTSAWEGIVTMHYSGASCTRVEIQYKNKGSSNAYTTGLFHAYSPTYPSSANPYTGEWNFMSPSSNNGAYLYVRLNSTRVTMLSDGLRGWTNPDILAYDNGRGGAAGDKISGSASTEGRLGSQVDNAYSEESFFVMLEFANGGLTDADYCDTQDTSSRRNLEVSISGSESPWTVTIDNTSYTVTKDSNGGVVLSQGSSTKGSWVLSFSGITHFFDPSVYLHMSNSAVLSYGLAAAIGDFSHAVATFEAGYQPTNAEVLGRLARMSRADVGGMLYLHPENGALADELDRLRPVPRFWRTEGDPSGQTYCQPGLSVWYCRPGASECEPGAVQRSAPVTEGVIENPAFLQLTVLALRMPSAFASRLVLGVQTGGSDIDNHFKLRFVAWRSPAEQWDGSNAFAMAAMASMPSVYRSDGEASVAWQVDCTGGLLRFGTRNMTAERIGVSQPVSGAITTSTPIEIPLSAPVAAGDVVLIAPEVIGFADGTGGESKWFGRTVDPATATDAGKGWARYAHNLGWFPMVTGE